MKAWGLDRPVLTRALALALSAWVAFAIATLVHVQNAYWAAMPVWVVAQPVRGVLVERAQRNDPALDWRQLRFAFLDCAEATADLGERNGRRGVRNGQADDVAARLHCFANAVDRGGDVARVGVRHRLDGDRRAAADGHAAELDAVGLSPGRWVGGS